MSVHPHQTRGTMRHPNASVVTAPPAAQQFTPPAPTPLLKPTEVKRQFQMHADFQTYAKAVKKYLNGSITKTEFHAELAKVLPTKDKCTYLMMGGYTLKGERGDERGSEEREDGIKMRVKKN